MNKRNESIQPTPGVNANDLRDANDPIYPDTVTDQSGHRTVGNVNADPVTGEHGSHPVGTGLGAAAGGALAGIGLGAAAGPVGAAIGAVVGGVAGAFAGKSVAEAIDPTVEDAYWRDEYQRRDYYQPVLSTRASAPHTNTAGNREPSTPIEAGTRPKMICVVAGKRANRKSAWHLGRRSASHPRCMGPRRIANGRQATHQAALGHVD